MVDLLLGIRSAVKQDFNVTPAEMQYRQPILLPGEFLVPRINSENATTSQSLKELKENISEGFTTQKCKDLCVQRSRESR